MESWFDFIEQTETTTEHDVIQAFADDQIILLTGKSLHTLENKWTKIWTACDKWAKTYKLKYNSDKTEVMFIPHRPTRPPRLRINNQIITPSENLKYLGLTFDTGLLWLDHVKMNRQKAADICHKLFIIAGKDWGRTPKMLKAIYENAIKPMLLYGAEIWGKRAKDTRIAKQLAAAERPFLRAITRAYKTAPTAALHVLAGTTPLNIDAFAIYKTYNENKNSINNLKLKTPDTPHPTNRTIKLRQDINTPDIKVYTDASIKSDNNRESKAIGIYIENQTDTNRLKYKIKSSEDINSLEARALAKSAEIITQHIQDYENKTITFHTDSTATLRQIQNGNNRNKIINMAKLHLEKMTEHNIHYNIVKTDRQNAGLKIAHNLANTAHNNTQDDITVIRKQDIKQLRLNTRLAAWQQSWDTTDKGRKTYSIYKTVRLTPPTLTWKATQLITGHGHLQAYYHMFNLRDTDGNCGHCNTTEDQHHVINTCTIAQRQTARQTLTQQLLQKQLTYPPTNIDITDKELTQWINEWGEQMILDDDTQDT
ncbi:uncharacterized protein [Diabrotica undecimpunctata]|uniref:uncharacterized protein n=1 Tax=Diabrotica undecimpunctata TaxID=50387 RepID=UPI003B638E0A